MSAGNTSRDPGAAARLHLLLGAGADSLAHCLKQLAVGDTVLLGDRGVEWLTDAVAMARLGAAAGAVLALEADCRARALSPPDGIGLVTDAQWPALVRAHRHALSWT
ncbi:MAG: DsrH/TusB family sulfur metabolism protein [Anaerolineae bacterium]